MTTFVSLERSPRRKIQRRILEWSLNQFHTIRWHFFGAVGEDVLVWGGRGLVALSVSLTHGGLCRIYFGDGWSSGCKFMAFTCCWVAKRFQINMIWQLAAFFDTNFSLDFPFFTWDLLVLRRPSSAQQSHLCDRRHFVDVSGRRRENVSEGAVAPRAKGWRSKLSFYFHRWWVTKIQQPGYIGDEVLPS